MSEYAHGDATRGIGVAAPTLGEYPDWAAGYIAAENPVGKVSAAVNLEDGWSLADHWGRPIDVASPPSRRVVRFIHAVRATHRWERGGESFEDTHVYHFDLTRLLPERRKDEIEAALGLQREETA
jgi:hypothetical protein